MRFDDLKFTSHTFAGEELIMARHAFDNGFNVSIIKELNNDSNYYNAAIVKNDSVVITEIHDKSKTFIIGSDYTFDLVDKRKVTTFLKNVESLDKDAPFADVYMDESQQMIVGKNYPANDILLKIINKITPLKNMDDE